MKCARRITACPHVARKHHALGMCHPCHSRHYERTHPERATAYRRKYQRGYYAKNTRRVRDRSLKSQFGLPVGQYDLMLSQQGGACAICQRPEIQVLHGKQKSLAVDHNHATGSVRGLLCARCNTRIGWFEEFHGNVLEYLNIGRARGSE